MEHQDTVIIYASPNHLNTMLILAKSIAKHHPNIHVTILCSAATSSASSISAIPSITYRRISSVDIPPRLTKDPVELFFELPRLNNPNLLKTLEEISQQKNIKAFIIDFFCYSATEVSTSLNIPTYFYISGGAFWLCELLYFPNTDEKINGKNIGDLREFIHVPGCPPIYSLDFPKDKWYRESNTYKHFLDMARTMRRSSGIIVNSYDALEYRAKEALSNGLCIPDEPTPPVYFVGPLTAEISTTHRNGSTDDNMLRQRHECLRWLDSQPSKSVVFLCFGRRGLLSVRQLRDIAIGLERSGHRFLWSVRSPPSSSNKFPPAGDEEPDLNVLMPEGFMDRVKDRGFIIKSWAPQTEILSHGSTGGFVTHCGRSSVLEALSFGVPMIGWPIDAEQRISRVFMVNEMKVALQLDEEEDGHITAVELENRVKELLGSSAFGMGLRRRVEELKISAEAAVAKNGSSVVALGRFVEDLKKKY